MFDLDLSLEGMLTAIELDDDINPNHYRVVVVPADDENYSRSIGVWNAIELWGTMTIRHLVQEMPPLAPEIREEISKIYAVEPWSDAEELFDIALWNVYSQQWWSDAVDVFHNAFRHGNKEDLNLPINLRYYSGRKGYIIEVEDQGEGFPVRQTIDLFHRQDEPNIEPYWTDEGQAFHNLHGSKNHIAYNDKGNICRVMHLKTEYQS